MLGPDTTDDKAIRILNRCLEWRKDGLYYEAAPKHAEIIIADLGPENANSVVTPSVKQQNPNEETLLPPDEARRFRKTAATCQFLAMNRCDLQHPVKGCARGMATRSNGDFERHKRIGR